MLALWAKGYVYTFLCISILSSFGNQTIIKRLRQGTLLRTRRTLFLLYRLLKPINSDSQMLVKCN